MSGVVRIAVPLFRKRLLRWFEKNRRELPWRKNVSPYSVWISEIMLQQTVVAAVIPRFQDWMKRYPDVATLASATEREILRVWEGLGYYARARNILKTARLIHRSGGRFPDSYEELIQLPGIGDYTGCAILSLAFGKNHAVLDANVRRILQRLMRAPQWNARVESNARGRLAELLSPKQPGRFNEAMMELGALVCTPKRPHCPQCPVSDFCAAYTMNAQDRIPAKLSRSVIKLSTFVWLALSGDKIIVRRRGANEINAGLWGFPESGTMESTDMPIKTLKPYSNRFTELPSVTHAYTRYRNLLHPRIIATAPGIRLSDSMKWIPLAKLDSLPFPSAYRRIVLALHEHLDTLRIHGDP